MGATFKENVSDIRNSKVVDLIRELISYGLEVDVIDPHANNSQMKHEYDIELINEPSGDYDAIVLAVNHQEYMKWDENDVLQLCKDKALFVDVKGVFKTKINKIDYLSL